MKNDFKLGINAYSLKIIAIIAMTLDHISGTFENHLSLTARVLLITPGGLTFPIMAFLLVEGYQHTRSVKKYGQRLLIFAFVALIPYILAFQVPILDVLFTLFLGLSILYLYDNMTNRIGFWFTFAGFVLLSSICDWMLMGVPMILCYHAIKSPLKRLIIPILFPIILTGLDIFATLNMDTSQTLMTMLPEMLYAVIGCGATIPLLYHYSGERGKPMKYFFYAFYPAHLLILAIIRMIFF
ncbi:TraX family protein [Pseudolactococcus yaeyamensis]